MTQKSLIEVDPDIRDAHWLREYALRPLGHPGLQQFPTEGMKGTRNQTTLPFGFVNTDLGFDWETCLSSVNKVLYTLADIDQ